MLTGCTSGGLLYEQLLCFYAKSAAFEAVHLCLVLCRPSSHQAQELLQAINTTRHRYDMRPNQIAADLKGKQLLPAVSDASQVWRDVAVQRERRVTCPASDMPCFTL